MNIEHILKDKLPFYESLDEKQQKSLLLACELQTLKKDESVIRSNFLVEDIVIVLDGTLRSFMSAPSLNKQLVLFTLEEYDVCILSNSKNYSDLGCRFTELRATNEATILFIKGDVFKTICETHIPALTFMLSITQHKLTLVLQKLHEIVFFSTEKRIIRYLLSLTDLQNSLTLTIRHDEIALELGTAREVVSKIVKKLEKEQFVLQKGRGQLEIIDISALAKL